MKNKINLFSVVLLLLGVFFRWIPYEEEQQETTDAKHSRNVNYGRAIRINKSNTKTTNQLADDDRQSLALFTTYIAKLEDEPQVRDGERNRFELGNLFRKLSGTLLFSQGIFFEEEQ